MKQIYYLWKRMKEFLFKKPIYTVYIINDVTWYRLEKESPLIKFPKAVEMIKKMTERILFINNLPLF